MNQERKLATIQTIGSITPIEGADSIEVASVNGWNVVVKKGEYAVGDMAIYCEIDSFLPIRDEFEFLRKSSFKKMEGVEGFRLKTIKLRGQLSQGLLLPMSTLITLLDRNNFETLMEGDDVTETIGIVKYEKPIPSQLAGICKGNFPSFIPKTNEERVQNLSKYYEQYRDNNIFYVTEKMDGSSATFYMKDGTFGVCSRNLDLIETDDNSFWKQARLLDIENKLFGMGNFALQGELIGTGIQGNPYCINGTDVLFFNAFDIDTQTYLPLYEFMELMHQLGLKTVPVLSNNYTLPESVKTLLLEAEGKSAIHPSVEREGIVIRSLDRIVSFKAISNSWLLKEK